MKGILSFLDNESIFGRICTVIGTVIMVNLMFVVTLIPVVTAGAGLCAMYYAMLKLIRYKEINPFAEFWEGFRDNFKLSLKAELMLIAVFAFLAVDVQVCAQMRGMLSFCILVVYAAVIAAAVLTMYLFPVMASFYGGLRTAVRYSFFFAGSNLLRTLAIAVLNIVPLWLTYANPHYLPLSAFLWCTDGFALIALCNSTILMRSFKPHLAPLEEDAEAADMKKILEEMRRLEG